MPSEQSTSRVRYQMSVEAVISVTAHSPAEALQIARELVSKMIGAATVSPDAVSAYAHTHPTNRDDPVWKEYYPPGLEPFQPGDDPRP